MALAIATLPAWLMLNRQSVTPRSRAAWAAPPFKTTSGGPPVSRRTTTSLNATPAPNPVPRAFSTASLAANLPASRSIRSGLLDRFFSRSRRCGEAARDQRGSRGSSIHLRSAASSTRSIPCPITLILQRPLEIAVVPDASPPASDDGTITIKCSEEISHDDGILILERRNADGAPGRILIETISCPNRIDCAQHISSRWDPRCTSRRTIRPSIRLRSPCASLPTAKLSPFPRDSSHSF